MAKSTGNVQPQLDLIEHQDGARGKRVYIVGLEDDGNTWVNPTVKEFASRNALEVVLVNTSGDLYNASGGGGVDRNVTVVGWVPGVTAQAEVGIAGGTVTAFSHIGGWDAGVTAKAEVGIAGGTVTAFSHVGGWGPSVTANAEVGVAGGVVTANGLAELTNPQVTMTVDRAFGTDVRSQTFFVPPDGMGAPRQLPAMGGNFAGIVIHSPSTNVTQVFLGPADVTLGIEVSGLALEPGDAVSLPVDNLNRVYAVADGTSTLYLSAMGVIR